MFKLLEHKQQKPPVRIMTSTDLDKLFNKVMDKVTEKNSMFTIWHERELLTEQAIKKNPVIASFPYGRSLPEKSSFELYYTITKHRPKAPAKTEKVVQKKGSKKTPPETKENQGE